MTSKEFEKAIKELGYEYVCDKNDIEYGTITEYATTKDGKALICTTNDFLYDIDTNWSSFESLPKEEKDKLFYVFYQYIKTNIKDRGLNIKKEEKTNTEYHLDRE